jgi:hypothetical protein
MPQPWRHFFTIWTIWRGFPGEDLGRPLGARLMAW